MTRVTRSDEDYLSDKVPEGVKYDYHKDIADQVSGLYSLEATDGFQGFMSGKRLVSFARHASRIQSCGSFLEWWQADSGEYTLAHANFCRVPNCPMCQWRRALRWRSKFLTVLPEIQAQYPSARWVMLTLTLRNCPLSELRETIKHMGQSFRRLSQLADFPLEGWIKSLEVTRVWDWYDGSGRYLGRHGTTWYFDHKAPDSVKATWTVKPTDEVHPHFHNFGMVLPSYFSGTGYVKQSEWAEMWQQSLRVDYSPIVDIRAVKGKKGQPLVMTPEQIGDRNLGEVDDSGMIQAICEAMKYTVKEQDLVGSFCKDDLTNSWWLKQATKELYKVRKVEYGGVLKRFAKELKDSKDDGANDGSDELEKEGRRVVAFWNRKLKRYIISSSLSVALDLDDGM
jgi:plasmid rolling circle replication initiator protein Rep